MNGTIFAASKSGAELLVAIDAASGSQLWQYQFSGGIGLTVINLSDVLLIGNDGALYVQVYGGALYRSNP